jgi:hypothetical protein
MKFIDILPYLNQGSRFAIAEWPADTYIGKSKEGFIAFTFKANLQEAKWTPSRYDVYDANWKTLGDAPLPTLKNVETSTVLFRLLDDSAVSVQRENITGTIDVAGFDDRGKLYFENVIDGKVVPCEPGLELMLAGDWYIKATAEEVTRALADAGQHLEPAQQPMTGSLVPAPAMVDTNGPGTVVVEEVHASVEILRQSAVSFAPEVTSDQEPGLRIAPGVYTAQGTMQQLLVEVHSSQDNIAYLTPYPTVPGAPQEVISASLFEAMFSQLPRLTVGVTMRHKERGALVTVQDFDDNDVMVAIDLGYDTGNGVIPRERFMSDDWEFVSYQPETPPVSESNAAPAESAEHA